jgi:hypothetical protein
VDGRLRTRLIDRRPAVKSARWIWLSSIALVAYGEPTPPPPPPTPPPPPAVVEAPPPPPPVRPGPTCTYHGVCSASPLPQGNALNAVVALAPDHVVAVGDRGTILVWNGAAWALEDAPTRERLLDVWAGVDGDLWSVGDHGTVLHRTTTDGVVAWTSVPSSVELTLRAIGGRSITEIWAGGDEGFLARWDGSTWTREALPAEVTASMSIVDVASRAPDTLYALARSTLASGPADAVLMTRTAAEGWRVTYTIDDDLSAIWIDPAGELVLAGERARHGDGVEFRRRDFDTDRPLDAIWGAAADDAWAVGYEGRIAHWTGSAWRDASLETTLDFHAIAGTSATDAWAVGEHGLVARLGADGWTIQSSGPTARLEGVFGASASDVWAVGDHAALHFDGGTWSALGPDDVELEALSGAAGIYVGVGAEGAIRRFANGAWTTERSGTHEKLEGVWVIDATHAIAVGASVWLQQDGSDWRAIEGRPPATSVWGSSANDVWAVGPDGIEHWDGAAWSHASGIPEGPLFAVWGRAANDVWAAGASGRLLHFDGGTWTASESGTTQNLLGLWGRAANDVWAVGHHGTLLHFDGTSWRWRDAGTDELLHAVWGADTGDVWAVGHGGSVLRIVSSAQ